MAAPPKKSFNSYLNMLKSGLKGMKKYSDNSRRGFLVIVEDNTGLHKFGTKHLVDKFTATKSCEACECDDSWESAAKMDTKDLNSEDVEDVANVAAKANSTGNILASIYDDAEVSRLPFDVDIMSEKEAGNWILPELKTYPDLLIELLGVTPNFILSAGQMILLNRALSPTFVIHRRIS